MARGMGQQYGWEEAVLQWYGWLSISFFLTILKGNDIRWRRATGDEPGVETTRQTYTRITRSPAIMIGGRMGRYIVVGDYQVNNNGRTPDGIFWRDTQMGSSRGWGGKEAREGQGQVAFRLPAFSYLPATTACLSSRCGLCLFTHLPSAFSISSSSLTFLNDRRSMTGITWPQHTIAGRLLQQPT